MLKVDFSNIFLLIIAIVSTIALLMTKKYPNIKKYVVPIVSISYLIIILLLTLQPLFIPLRSITFDDIRLNGLPWNIRPFSLIIPQWKNVLLGQRGAFKQFVGNIVVFIPAGLLMPFIFKKTKKVLWALLGGFLFTFTIESLQFVLCIAGMCLREFDIDDLILNTFGALIGHFIYKVLFYTRHNKETIL